MKNMSKKMMMLAAGLSLSAGLTAGAAQAAPAPAKVALPVVSGAQSITSREKAATAGQGLIDLNVTALNGLNVANNLNLLNILSFNKWISKTGSDCGCGIGPS